MLLWKLTIQEYIGDNKKKTSRVSCILQTTENELEVLNRIVSLYLDFAELQAMEENPMTMNDWVNQLDYFLKMSKKDILQGKGIISHKQALEHATKEYNRFKNRLFSEPTEIEDKYIRGINELIKIENKKD